MSTGGLNSEMSVDIERLLPCGGGVSEESINASHDLDLLHVHSILTCFPYLATYAFRCRFVVHLQTSLTDLVSDQYGHRVLLQLLAPDCSRYLPQAILEMMHPPQRTIVGGTGKMITDIEGDEVRAAWIMEWLFLLLHNMLIIVVNFLKPYYNYSG